MNIIKVEEFTPKAGEECNGNKYPHPGVFVGEMFGSRQMAVVDEQGMCFFIGTPPVKFLEKVDEPATSTSAPIKEPVKPSGFVSEGTLLKALAMAHGAKVSELNIN